MKGQPLDLVDTSGMFSNQCFTGKKTAETDQHPDINRRRKLLPKIPPGKG